MRELCASRPSLSSFENASPARLHVLLPSRRHSRGATNTHQVAQHRQSFNDRATRKKVNSPKGLRHKNHSENGTVLHSVSPTLEGVLHSIIPRISLFRGTTLTKVTKKKRKVLSFVLDLNSTRVSWSTTNPTKQFHIDDIRSIHLQEAAVHYRRECLVADADERLWFTVVCKNRSLAKQDRTIHLLAPNSEIFELWTWVLIYLKRKRDDLIKEVQVKETNALPEGGTAGSDVLINPPSPTPPKGHNQVLRRRYSMGQIRRGKHKQPPPFVVEEMSYRQMHRSPSLSRLSRSLSFGEVVQKTPSPPRPLSRSRSFRDPLPSQLDEPPKKPSIVPLGNSQTKVMQWMNSDEYLEDWSSGYASRSQSRRASSGAQRYHNPKDLTFRSVHSVVAINNVTQENKRIKPRQKSIAKQKRGQKA